MVRFIDYIQKIYSILTSETRLTLKGRHDDAQYCVFVCYSG